MTRILSLATALFLAATALVSAAEVRDWDKAAFDAAEASGQSIVVHVTAPWCGTCTAQHTAIDALITDPAFDKLVIFNVDFDSQKDVMQGFGTSQRSTLIAFKGTSETERLIGETDPAVIEKLVKSAL